MKSVNCPRNVKKEAKAMSDFELISLFNELFNTAYARLNDYLVGLFGMLVAAHFVAPKLNRMMAWLIASLYTIFSVATIFPAIVVTDRFTLAARQVKIAADRPGSILSEMFTILPSREIVTPVMTVLLVAAYVASMLYFFQARRRKLDE
jgi:hypothetical protein